MSTFTTTGIELRSRSRWLRDGVELVSSMRFSISLLTVICIASVIGTVVKQHEPLGNYINQFGPFWARVFAAVGLDTVYSVWWFLLILAFLVISTTLCIARNVPKIIKDLGTYKEHLREQSLMAFHHKGQAELTESPAQAYERISKLLVASGWRAKVEVRRDGEAVRCKMIAARRGAANKLGYIAAHSAIVLVCLGGLFDGDLMVRAQMALQGKSTFSGGGMMGEIEPEHRLGVGNPAFRANLFVPEGASSSTAVINMGDGMVLQDLPFDVELKKFNVDYYATGMPKLFSSDIVIHDHDTGATTAATVKVNEPVFHRGVAIYQSSFDDGGSTLKLRALPMVAGGKGFDVQGVVGGSTELSNGGSKMTLEFTGLRVINVENLTGSGGPTDVRKVDLVSSVESHLGSGAKGDKNRDLHNVGPSISYKLRDASGQAREFNNYMLPVELDGQRVFLAGTRDRPDQSMRYLRIPADERGTLDGWMRLRAGLLDPALRDKAAARYVALATPTDKPQMAAPLLATTQRALALFAGAKVGQGDAPAVGGLTAISNFMEGSVPEAERSRISEVLLRILNGSLFELLNLTRENAGLAPLQPDAKTQSFMTQAVLSLSDSFFYPAPVLLELVDFKQVQASVFQVARAPGK
ncbi:MAG TPA: cytochrome c biogenesis protein ResB, partial [Burkholderiaceae bacterium]|nr:cytochrome c biogenesis protein ResB [Burkholderiaceae bacterium]